MNGLANLIEGKVTTMTRAAKRIESPGIEPVPQPEESTMIGGRAESWSLPRPRSDDEQYEPYIVRGRE